MRALLTGAAARRLLSLLVVAAVVAVGITVYLHGGGGAPISPTTSGQTTVRDPDPDLAAMKARAGVRDCASGPGGGALPGVTVSCLGGGPSVDLASLRGPMLVSFWASWCGPCGKEMPALQAFDQQHGSQVPVLGVDFLDQYPASALQQMKQRGATYPSLADPTGVLQEEAAFAKFAHLPVLVFLDAQGRIAFEKFGGVDSESEVTDLVRQHLGVDL